jgi:N-acyl-D-aspartate/D-glutamate deacylase
MDYDLVIRNGLVVDGSGTPGRRADVAVVGDRVVEVGDVDGNGHEEIDADGLVVAPGFVDGHTHMDAQVFWDELGTSSCWHGVTTVAMGNCGFSLAPAPEAKKALVVRNLERAEDIAAEAMEAGITSWTWSTFAEYLDSVDAQPKGINYAAAVGHSALRTFVMGERAFEETASEHDIEAMKQELADALHAGAAGFTTSRSNAHNTSDDRPVASRLAAWDEVVALVELVGRESTGIFEIAGELARVSGEDERRDYYGRLETLALSSRVPIVFGVFQSPGLAGALPVIEETVARGGQMYGLTHCRGVSTMQSFRTRLAFDLLPEWQEVRAVPFDQQRKLLQDPDVRSRLVHAAQHGDYSAARGVEAKKPNYDTLQILRSPYLRNPTVAEEARRRGVDPVNAMIDLALETDFNILFVQVVTPQTDDDVVDLLRNRNTAMTFSDAGAHVSQIADSSIFTHLLAYWVRERQAFSLEEAIRMITRQPAMVWRLHDRGMLAPGYAADITIFDAETIAPHLPRVVSDLPGGARRLVQQADGYAATIVNGKVMMRDGEPTEHRSGRLLRANRLSVPA